MKIRTRCILATVACVLSFVASTGIAGFLCGLGHPWFVYTPLLALAAMAAWAGWSVWSVIPKRN